VFGLCPGRGGGAGQWPLLLLHRRGLFTDLRGIRVCAALPALPTLGDAAVDIPARGPSLLVRVDQPVEGVEFQPHTLLRDGDGGVVTAGNRRLEYSWLRSKTKRTCEEPTCPKQREAACIQDLVRFFSFFLFIVVVVVDLFVLLWSSEGLRAYVLTLVHVYLRLCGGVFLLLSCIGNGTAILLKTMYDGRV